LGTSLSRRLQSETTNWFDHERRRRIAVLVSQGHDPSARFTRWIVSPSRQFGTALDSVGGSAGVPVLELEQVDECHS
jgi:hypothetical protein